MFDVPLFVIFIVEVPALKVKPVVVLKPQALPFEATPIVIVLEPKLIALVFVFDELIPEKPFVLLVVIL